MPPAGPTQYRLLSPHGSLTMHSCPWNRKAHRSSPDLLRRISVTPATDESTRFIGPNDHGMELETSKAPIEPSGRLNGCVRMTPNYK